MSILLNITFHCRKKLANNNNLQCIQKMLSNYLLLIKSWRFSKLFSRPIAITFLIKRINKKRKTAKKLSNTINNSRAFVVHFLLFPILIDSVNTIRQWLERSKVLFNREYGCESGI